MRSTIFTQFKSGIRYLTVVLFLGIAFSFGLVKSNSAIGQVLQTYTSGTGSWTCPAGVTHVMVQVWGAGGGGGNSATTSGKGGCGGGAGAYSESIIAVTAGTTYYYSVGAGGTGAPASSTTAATNGGDSWFNTVNSAPTSTAGVLAKRGAKGNNNSSAAGGSGGVLGAGYGTNKWSGGNGGSGYGSGGGGGAGSAGRYGNGGSGVSAFNGGAGGTAGAYGGAAGGNGSSSTNGASGAAPGGGGGGSNDAPGASGGAGGAGRIIISKNLIMPYAGTTTLTNVGGTSTIYDPAYDQNYYNNEIQTLVLIPSAGSILTLTFTSFNTEANYDFLYVYNGNSTLASQVTGSPFSGTSLPAAITSTAADGSLTLFFDSDASAVAAGFVATLTASIPLPTVTTTSASSIGNFSATSGGNVTSSSAAVTARGVLWGHISWLIYAECQFNK